MIKECVIDRISVLVKRIDRIVVNGTMRIRDGLKRNWIKAILKDI